MEGNFVLYICINLLLTGFLKEIHKKFSIFDIKLGLFLLGFSYYFFSHLLDIFGDAITSITNLNSEAVLIFMGPIFYYQTGNNTNW